MTPDIALILGIDGIATGSIYVLVGLGLVLIFSVTRVVFVPFGDIVAFSALTLASLQLGRMPGTVYLVATLAVGRLHCRQLCITGAAASRIGSGAGLIGYGILPLAAGGASPGSLPARACRAGRRSRSPSRLSFRSRR